MFRATSCSSSGESIVSIHTSGICHSVSVTVSCAGRKGTTWLWMDEESLNEYVCTTIQQVSYQNYACRFHYKGNVLSNSSKSPEDHSLNTLHLTSYGWETCHFQQRKVPSRIFGQNTGENYIMRISCSFIQQSVIRSRKYRRTLCVGRNMQ
jgi:hypothetical protein